jgi:hypothetical protein
MVSVTGDTGLADQFVVKDNLRCVLNGIFANLSDCMTYNAPVIADSTERIMAGHAFVGQVLVSLAQ